MMQVPTFAVGGTTILRYLQLHAFKWLLILAPERIDDWVPSITVIFPHIDDENLLRFQSPFSRMMFGYGRAMVALRQVALGVLGDEDKAVRFMLKVKSNTMEDKFRELCAPTFEPDRLNALLGQITTLTDLYRRRNMIVHGEWRFNVFALTVRDWIEKKAAQFTLKQLRQKASTNSGGSLTR